MKHAWPIVKLGEVLNPVQRAVEPVAGTMYRQLGVRLWGEGAYERDSIDGAQTTYSSLFLAEADDVIVNKIWARNGSVAVVHAPLAGCYGSTEFPMFAPLKSRILPRWMHWLTKQPDFWAQCDEKSKGTSGKNRIKPSQFLQVEIPLPPLAEQLRIVARIEELASRIEEARTLRKQAVDEAAEILFAVGRGIWPEQSLLGARRLDEVTSFLARGRQSEQGESSHYLIKTQHVQQCRYISTSMRLAEHVAIKVKSEAQLKDNDILIACSAAGCIGRVAQYKDDGRVASTDTHVAIARANTEVIDPEYLYAYLNGAQGQYQLRSRERGDWQREKISFRLAELNLNDLRQVPVPVPPFENQKRIVAELHKIQSEIDQIKQLHAETAAELDALLPALLDRAFKGEL